MKRQSRYTTGTGHANAVRDMVNKPDTGFHIVQKIDAEKNIVFYCGEKIPMEGDSGNIAFVYSPQDFVLFQHRPNACEVCANHPEVHLRTLAGVDL